MCAITVNGQQLLASGGGWGSAVRVLGPRHRRPARPPSKATFQGWLNAVCPVTVNGRELLASGGSDSTVRIWDPATGHQHATLQGHQGSVNAVCAVTVNGRELLASGGNDGTVRIWDPATGEQHAALEGHQGQVNAVCAITVNGQQLLASGGGWGVVRVWDPGTGDQHAALEGHQGAVNAVCAITVNGQQLAGQRRQRPHGPDPGTPATGRCLLILPTYHRVLAIALVGESMAVGLSGGILVINLNSLTYPE